MWKLHRHNGMFLLLQHYLYGHFFNKQALVLYMYVVYSKCMHALYFIFTSISLILYAFTSIINSCLAPVHVLFIFSDVKDFRSYY